MSFSDLYPALPELILAIGAMALLMFGVYRLMSMAHSTCNVIGNSVAAMVIATLNGLSADAVSAQFTASPTGDSNNAIQATVTTSNPIYFASVVGAGHNLSVGATSYAEIRSGTPGAAG